LDGIAGIKFLFNGKFNHCFAIIKAHFSFYYHLKECLKKRENNQKIEYFKTKSIVYNYFIQKKNIFQNNF
jgi:hypothetical protein